MERFADLERRALEHVGSLVLAAVLIAFAGSAVHLARFDEVRDRQATTQQQPGPQDGPVSDPRAEVGPRIGDPLRPYLDARAEVLEGFPDAVVVRAVVSFEDYLQPGELELPVTVVVEAVQIRIPIADVPPTQQVVEDGDLEAAVAAAVAEDHAALEEELRDLRTTLESDIGDLAFEEDFEQRLEELAELDTLLDDDPAVLFAVVVSGTAAELRALADHPQVRLVDPGGRQEDTERSRFYGLLPDDDVRATHGRPL